MREHAADDQMPRPVPNFPAAAGIQSRSSFVSLFPTFISSQLPVALLDLVVSAVQYPVRVMMKSRETKSDESERSCAFRFGSSVDRLKRRKSEKCRHAASSGIASTVRSCTTAADSHARYLS